MLENVKIIDTPGINDPVVSREERTMALIAECDVVFLLSPVGQFLSEQDLTLLNTISNKNGIKEFYAVASQFDIALFAPENISNGNLSQAIKKAQEPLKRQQNSIFNAKKRCIWR